MPIAISEAHRELESVARAFLEKHGARGESRALLDAADEARPAFWAEAAHLGWCGLHLPEEYGGSGYGMPELVVVVQEFGRAVAPGPFVPSAIVSALINDAGDDAQRAALLPGLADGTTTAAIGLGAGLTLDGTTLNGDGGVVIGAGLADLLAFVVGDDVVVVDRDADGVSRSGAGNLDPTRRCSRIQLAGVTVDEARILRGAAPTATNLARLIFSAEAAGGAQECVERSTEYAKVREQFGRVIAMFQAVKHHCANMLVASELATAAVWDAARAHETGGDVFALAAAVAATESIATYLTNAQLNIQVHGGIGFTWEHDAHLLLRRAATIVALVDADGAAADVSRLRLAGVTRTFGLELPPEAEEVRAEIRAFAEETAALSADAQRTRLIETGYVQPHWPKPWGREAAALEQLVIEEEFKAAGVKRPQYGITTWVILTLIQHGTDDQITRWVRPTLDGTYVWCQLFSEPDAGSDAAAVRTKATRVDGGFLINGQKVWTSGAHYSRYGLATVRTNPDAPKHQGVTTVVIDMQAEGVDVRPLREATGASLFNEVFFNDVFVPDDDVVGPVDGGWTVARATLGNERVSIGGGTGVPLNLDLIELMRSAGQETNERWLVDVGNHVAEEHTLRLLNLRSAERAVAGAEPGPEGNVTKLVGAENMQASADLALKLLGPDVVVNEGIGQLITMVLIFSRAMTIAGGTSEITRNQIGERILGLPRDPLIK